MLHISSSAAKQLRKISKHKYILFYVQGGGCNGFHYKFESTNEKPKPLDEIVEHEDIKIIIDSTSVFHLLGTTIDWKKDIMGETFHFENPNAASQCGCGTSFSVL